MARGDFPSTKQDQFNLRFPEGMRAEIQRLAAED
ncbi:Arc family DNA-binding protein, partial [Rhizobium ruizarguesonis]